MTKCQLGLSIHRYELIRVQSSGIWLGGNHGERPGSWLPREALRAPVGSASALATVGAGTRAHQVAGNSAIPFPGGAVLFILELAEQRPPKLREPEPSPLLERSNRPFCPEGPARPPSSDSRYSGWGPVTFGVTCFPGWSVQIRMRASLFPFSPGVRTPLAFCSAALAEVQRPVLLDFLCKSLFGIFANHGQ